MTTTDWRQTDFSQYLDDKVAQQLEQSLYQRLKKKYEHHDLMQNDSEIFQKIYKARVRDLLVLFDPEQRSYQEWLVKQLNQGTLSADKLVVMKPWESSPALWKASFDAYQRDIANLGQTAKATSNLFLCRRCNKKETTYYEMQSRSSDEPMTTYINCTNCGNQWKQ